jgi:hypothetical protein
MYHVTAPERVKKERLKEPCTWDEVRLRYLPHQTEAPIGFNHAQPLAGYGEMDASARNNTSYYASQLACIHAQIV